MEIIISSRCSHNSSTPIMAAMVLWTVGNADNLIENENQNTQLEENVNDEHSQNSSEEEDFFVSRRDRREYFQTTGYSMEDVFDIADRVTGPQDPTLGEFNLWHIRNKASQFDYWLQYHGYHEESDIRQVLSKFINKLSDKFKKGRTPVDADGISLVQIWQASRPPIAQRGQRAADHTQDQHSHRRKRKATCLGPPSVEDMIRMEHQNELAMTYGGWGETRSTVVGGGY